MAQATTTLTPAEDDRLSAIRAPRSGRRSHQPEPCRRTPEPAWMAGSNGEWPGSGERRRVSNRKQAPTRSAGAFRFVERGVEEPTETGTLSPEMWFICATEQIAGSPYCGFGGWSMRMPSGDSSPLTARE